MKIAVLCSNCQTTDILLSRLSERASDTVLVLREPKLPATTILRHRLRRLGMWTTLGQIAFMALVPPLLTSSARARTQILLSEHTTGARTPVGMNIRDVPQINDQAVVDALAAFRPDVVLVNGTRIIRARVLDSVEAAFVNVHAGITPQYRGVHGGYWALYSGDAANFGATIHLVDKGVDTGPVLAHVRTAPGAADNFTTYPLLQYLVALPRLEAILDGLPGSLARTVTYPADTPSKQWYHPTLLQYLRGYIRGIS